MLFNSFTYLFFLLLVFVLHWKLFSKNKNHQNVFLIAVSYLFYAFWSYKFLFLLFAITLLDFYYGFQVQTNKKRRRIFLYLSILNNLGILFVFKYYNFFISEFSAFMNLFEWNFNLKTLELVLPIGISFYTFHGISYVVDIYNERRTPVRDFIEYALFVSYFPLLVSGPIERANHLLPQLNIHRIFRDDLFKSGLRLIVFGLFKKVVIADGLSPFVDTCFRSPSELNSIVLILGIISFSFQIYCDFSGYSEIAIGTSNLLGINLVSNFYYPYFSKSIPEFWRRWHISLSSWFRDYLYIPLGGSKKNKYITYRNIFLVFLLSGFWHGANWTFIFWGFLHFIAFIPYKFFRKDDYQNDAINIDKPSDVFKVLVTFLYVSFCWIFFRSINISYAFLYIKSIVNNFQFVFFNYKVFRISIYPLLLIILITYLEWLNKKNKRDFHIGSHTNYLLTFILYLCIMFMLSRDQSFSFIYFQF